MEEYEQALDRARMMLLLDVPPFGRDSTYQNLAESGVSTDLAYFAVMGALLLIRREKEEVAS